MLQDWDEATATWSDPQGSAGAAISNGVTPNDAEASAIGGPVCRFRATSGLVEIPIDRDTLQAWANGSLANFGWSHRLQLGQRLVVRQLRRLPSIDPFFPKLTISLHRPNGRRRDFWVLGRQLHCQRGRHAPR